MKLLLDTHILLGTLENDTIKFPAFIRRILDDPANEFYASVVSVWEIAIKFRIGKLPLTFNLEDTPGMIRNVDMTLIPINEHHALAGVEPEPATRDPFNRLLLAQCAMEGFRLVTIDRALMDHRLAAV